MTTKLIALIACSTALFACAVSQQTTPAAIRDLLAQLPDEQSETARAPHRARLYD